MSTIGGGTYKTVHGDISYKNIEHAHQHSLQCKYKSIVWHHIVWPKLLCQSSKKAIRMIDKTFYDLLIIIWQIKCTIAR